MLTVDGPNSGAVHLSTWVTSSAIASLSSASAPSTSTSVRPWSHHQLPGQDATPGKTAAGRVALITGQPSCHLLAAHWEDPGRRGGQEPRGKVHPRVAWSPRDDRV